jgi:hypothetical protein
LAFIKEKSSDIAEISQGKTIIRVSSQFVDFATTAAVSVGAGAPKDARERETNRRMKRTIKRFMLSLRA